MKIKLLDLVNAQDALDRLFTEAQPKAKLSYKLGMVQRSLTPFLNEYGRTQAELLRKYEATQQPLPNGRVQWLFLNEEGKSDLDRAAKYTAEMDELTAVEVDVGDTSIALNDLDRCKMERPLSPAEMAAMWWLIKDGVMEAEQEEDNG